MDRSCFPSSRRPSRCERSTCRPCRSRLSCRASATTTALRASDFSAGALWHWFTTPSSRQSRSRRAGPRSCPECGSVCASAASLTRSRTAYALEPAWPPPRPDRLEAGGGAGLDGAGGGRRGARRGGGGAPRRGVGRGGRAGGLGGGGGGSEHMVCFQALRKREEAKAAAAGGARRQLPVRLHIRYAVEKLVSFIHQSKNAAGRREQALFDGVVRRLVMVLGAQVLAEGKGAGDLDRQAFRAGSWRGGHCKTSLYEKVKKVAHAAQAADVLLAALLEEVVEELRARWVQAS